MKFFPWRDINYYTVSSYYLEGILFFFIVRKLTGNVLLNLIYIFVTYVF